MTIFCGVRAGDGVSEFYKAYLTQEIAGVGKVVVAGYISGDTTIELNQLWTSPFEGDTAGNTDKTRKASALLQTKYGRTSKTLWNSKMVWDGAEAPSFSLTLRFAAYADAKIEVDDPITYLMQMASPELKDKTPMGKIPLKVDIDIGRRVRADIYIKSVSYNEDAPKTKDNHFTHNEITLQVTLDGSVNASKIPEIFR
jgi:hypothetical protein